jgi:uroporphyrinogen-III synthase
VDGGTRIILTRESNRNREWAERLDLAGLAYCELPLLVYAAIAPTTEPDWAAFDWIIFTSPQGVQAFAELRTDLGRARCAVLGDGTAATVTTLGWQVDYNAAAHDGAEMVTGFLANYPGPGSVLMPGPKRRLAEPRASLLAAGYHVLELPLYETCATAATDVAQAALTEQDVVFFCSPSAVRAFTGARADKPRCVAIGQTTADACRAAGLDPAVADTPDLESMVRAAGLDGLPGPGSETVTPEMES